MSSDHESPADAKKQAAVEEAGQSAFQTRFDNLVVVLMALIAVWGTIVALLGNNASNGEELAALQAQAVAVESLGKFVRADQRSTFGLDVVAAWDAAGQRATQARASTDAARLRGDEARVRALEQTASRWLNVQQRLVSLTPLLAAEYNSDSIAYQEQLRRDAYLAYERQQAAMQTADGFGKKENSYTAVISSLAVVLFLMGLSLTMNNWLRYVFVGGGILISVASAVWVVVVAVRPVADTSEEAMKHFVDGLVASNRADFAVDASEADRLEKEAIQAFDAAVGQHELYANAYIWRGYTRLEDRLRFADADRNAIAAEDINRAIQLGIINSVSYTNLSWAHILSGNYEGAVEAAGAAPHSKSQRMRGTL